MAAGIIERIQVKLELFTARFSSEMKKAQSQLESMNGVLRKQQNNYRVINSRVRLVTANLKNYLRINKRLTSGQKGFVTRQRDLIASLGLERAGVANVLDITKKQMSLQRDNMNLMRRRFSAQSKVLKKNIKQEQLSTLSTEMNRLAQKGFGGIMALNTVDLKKYSEVNKTLRTRMGNVAFQIRNSTHGMRGFRMEMLGVMFFGMMMQRMFLGLLQPVMEAFGVFDIFRLMLLTLFLPVMEMMFPFLLKMMEWFMNLPEPVKKAIGIFVVLGLIFATIVMLIGSFALGIGSLILVFGRTFGFIMGVVAALAVVFVGLVLIVSGIVMIIKGKLEGIGIVIMGIGVILLLFIGWWALIPIAVGAVVYYIIKNWTKIKEFLGNVFSSIGGWFKKWFWDKPKEWLNNLWDFVKKIFEKVQKKISGSLLGKALSLTIGLLGSFQSGGIIPQTGPYLLHRGENVIPAGQSSTGGGSNITNNFYGFTMDDLKRELDDRDRRLVDELRRLVKT